MPGTHVPADYGLAAAPANEGPVKQSRHALCLPQLRVQAAACRTRAAAQTGTHLPKITVPAATPWANESESPTGTQKTVTTLSTKSSRLPYSTLILAGAWQCVWFGTGARAAERPFNLTDFHSDQSDTFHSLRPRPRGVTWRDMAWHGVTGRGGA